MRHASQPHAWMTRRHLVQSPASDHKQMTNTHGQLAGAVDVGAINSKSMAEQAEKNTNLRIDSVPRYRSIDS